MDSDTAVCLGTVPPDSPVFLWAQGLMGLLGGTWEELNQVSFLSSRPPLLSHGDISTA